MVGLGVAASLLPLAMPAAGRTICTEEKEDGVNVTPLGVTSA